MVEPLQLPALMAGQPHSGAAQPWEAREAPQESVPEQVAEAVIPFLRPPLAAAAHRPASQFNNSDCLGIGACEAAMVLRRQPPWQAPAPHYSQEAPLGALGKGMLAEALLLNLGLAAVAGLPVRQPAEQPERRLMALPVVVDLGPLARAMDQMGA